MDSSGSTRCVIAEKGLWLGWLNALYSQNSWHVVVFLVQKGLMKDCWSGGCEFHARTNVSLIPGQVLLSFVNRVERQTPSLGVLFKKWPAVLWRYYAKHAIQLLFDSLTEILGKPKKQSMSVANRHQLQLWPSRGHCSPPRCENHNNMCLSGCVEGQAVTDCSLSRGPRWDRINENPSRGHVSFSRSYFWVPPSRRST